ncbi:conjugative transfer signal peptidase TraF [Bosea sp. MMO-172]|uniref:conjugative transfer signal peptidase TraF n=1 Tax=Bosea sp. MMO-172 TaxID=3127885 RepID=UPI003FA5E483
MRSGLNLRDGSHGPNGAAGRRRWRQRRGAGTILVAGSLMVAVLAGGAWLGDLRLNVTPSEPLGLWRIVPLDRPVVEGDLVFICPPAGPVSVFGLERGYFRSGLCDGGAAPLIKIVAATTGRRILVAADVVIDGAQLPQSRTSTADGEGRSLSPWPGGVIQPGHLFLHSSFAGSYDSRYFGLVPEAGLLGLARPVLVFDP